MYKQLFGLKTNPFNVNPDPRFLCLTRYAREALACLVYSVRTRKGFVLLTGEVGTGKTTLLNKFLGWLRTQRVPTAFIFNPRLTTGEFLEYMMADFGIACEPGDKTKMLIALNRWLLQHYEEGRTAVLVIDEAQNLSTEVLEEIRLLANLETSTEKLLQIVLAGQPELDAKLKTQELRQLKQRISLRCRTMPLTQQETREYVEQRLRIAGASDGVIFTPEALDLIFKYSNGIPRVVNLICEHSLISAFVDQQKPVLPATVEQVAKDFELDEASVEQPPARHPLSRGESAGLIEALRVLATAGEKIRELQLERKGEGQ